MNDIQQIIALLTTLGYDKKEQTTRKTVGGEEIEDTIYYRTNPSIMVKISTKL